MAEVPAKPRRFRYSLITLLVAVNVAGVLVWANIEVVEVHNMVFHLGWPFVWLSEGGIKEWGIHPYELVANVLIGIALTAFAAISSEFLVRRIRKAKSDE